MCQNLLTFVQENGTDIQELIGQVIDLVKLSEVTRKADKAEQDLLVDILQLAIDNGGGALMERIDFLDAIDGIKLQHGYAAVVQE